jgi:hypothetical protein
MGGLERRRKRRFLAIREEQRVAEYADLMNRAPKTLANLF